MMPVPRPVVLYCAGCFNPVTTKHLKNMELARDALHRTGRYKVLQGILAPAHDKYGKEGLVPAVHRLEMMKLAVKSNSWLRADDWEILQSDWTPTAAALNKLRERLEAGEFADVNNTVDTDDAPQAKRKRKVGTAGVDDATSSSSDSPVSPLSNAQTKLLCGGDLLESFAVPDLWDKADMESIVRDHGLVVIVREGSDPYKFIYENDLLSRYSYNIEVITDWIGDGTSATKIRRAVQRNESIKYLVQDSVLDYIVRHKLYNPSYKPGHPHPYA